MQSDISHCLDVIKVCLFIRITLSLSDNLREWDLNQLNNSIHIEGVCVLRWFMRHNSEAKEVEQCATMWWQHEGKMIVIVAIIWDTCTEYCLLVPSLACCQMSIRHTHTHKHIFWFVSLWFAYNFGLIRLLIILG